MAGLTLIPQALKQAFAIANALKNADLLQALRGMEEAYVAVQKERDELRKQLELRDAFVFRENVYWRKSTAGELEGPFCPKCKDGVGNLARLQSLRGEAVWQCPVCNHYVDRDENDDDGPEDSFGPSGRDPVTGY